MNAAAGPAQAGSGRVEKPGRRLIQLALRVYGFSLQGLIAAALARHRPFACGDHTLTDAGGAFTRRRIDQLVSRHGPDFHMQVNAVHQGAAELALITRDLVG